MIFQRIVMFTFYLASYPGIENVCFTDMLKVETEPALSASAA